MIFFSPKAFEHLLFPLHYKVYVGIEKGLAQLEKINPGLLKALIDFHILALSTSTTQLLEKPEYFKMNGIPVFDMVVDIAETDLEKVMKTENYASFIVRHDIYGPITPGALNVHLVIHLSETNLKNSYIVPLPFIMRSMAELITTKGSYQLYQHVLIPKLDHGAPPPSTRDEYIKDSATYIGITKRTWQKRYKEHLSASRRGSTLRFHRAIRGELFDINISEHEIIRAGLSEEEVLRLEEIEVHNRSLFSTSNPNGLNMIPGGRKGLELISKAVNTKETEIDVDRKEFILERHLKQKTTVGHKSK